MTPSVHSRRRAVLFLATLVPSLVIPGMASAEERKAARTLRVGPNQAITTIAGAARAARSGDTVEIAAGTYAGDVAVWSQDELTIRGVGGRARIIAVGESVEGKGIWVFRGRRFRVENVEFAGAQVPDGNGAGIRHEKGSLSLKNTLFEDNQAGLLIANDPAIEAEVEDSEFRRNGSGDGSTHHLYAGTIGRLAVRGSYFREANVGHLLKSRARENFIFYNRLTDESDGRASYELEFANGGIAWVVGNLIEQGPLTENSVIVSYGAEGYRWPANELYFAHNTVANDRPRGGVFMRVHSGAGAVRLVNNAFVGKGDLDLRSAALQAGNARPGWEEFALPARLDFRPKRTSSLVGKAGDPGSVRGRSLRPDAEYVFPTGTRPLPGGTPLSVGAFQLPLD
jgi:hypothetical protein